MDKALIAKAARCLKLRNILLFEGNLKRFGEIGESKELLQQNKLIVRGETGEAVENDHKLRVFRVFVDLGVRIVEPAAQQGQEITPLFQIEATYQVDYELTDDVDQKALEEFARYNGVHNAWPFWRQFVFNTSNQAGLPCPDVPLRTDHLEQSNTQID